MSISAGITGIVLERSSELLVPILKQCRIWAQDLLPWHKYSLLMEALQPVFQHRPIRLFEHILSYFDDIVRPDAKEVTVKCSVMQLTKRQPIRDDGLPLGLAVRDYVCGVKQFLMFQVTKSALTTVSFEHPLPKRLLVHTL